MGQLGKEAGGIFPCLRSSWVGSLAALLLPSWHACYSAAQGSSVLGLGVPLSAPLQAQLYCAQIVLSGKAYIRDKKNASPFILLQSQREQTPSSPNAGPFCSSQAGRR